MTHAATRAADRSKARTSKAESRKAEPAKIGFRKAEAGRAKTSKAERPVPGGRPGRASVAPGQDKEPPHARADRQAQRREAILTAALEEFSARGFAATRLDDVARRAGVAKGTIYLYFSDKEDLFQELVRAMLSPVVGRLEAAPIVDLPARMLVEAIIDVFIREIFGTRRKDVIRLIITEGQRFPKLAEIYYHEVIERVAPAIRALMTRAVTRGELPNDALARFPQLLFAPAIVALVWNGLFSRFAPIDVRELLRAHIDIVFGERNAP